MQQLRSLSNKFRSLEKHGFKDDCSMHWLWIWSNFFSLIPAFVTLKKDYLLIYIWDTWRETGRVSSCGSLSKCVQWLGLSQAEVERQKCNPQSKPPIQVARTQLLEPCLLLPQLCMKPEPGIKHRYCDVGCMCATWHPNCWTKCRPGFCHILRGQRRPTPTSCH